MGKGVVGWKTIVHWQTFCLRYLTIKISLPVIQVFISIVRNVTKNDCMFYVWNIVKVTGKEPVLIKERKPKKSRNCVKIKNKEIYNRKKKKEFNKSTKQTYTIEY